MTQTAAQWAFSAITGYEIPGIGFSSASVDGWETMSKDQLMEEINAQVEGIYAADFITTDCDEDAVADAVLKYKNCESQDDAYQIYKSLDAYQIYKSLVRYAISDDANGILKEEGVFASEEDAYKRREEMVLESIKIEKETQEESGLNDEEIDEKVRDFISVEEI